MRPRLPGLPTGSRTRRRPDRESQGGARPKRRRKHPALHNLKIKHCNPLVYKDLVRELGCINLYNTTVAEQKKRSTEDSCHGQA